MSTFSVSEKSICHYVRAKYYRTPEGALRLASVQAFSEPRFRESGWENREKPNKCSDVDSSDEVEEIDEKTAPEWANIERAVRRARKHAFDFVMCNHDLDTFVTFTYSPESVSDKADYDECYKKLKVWLSNRVERRGLKYVLVPERTKAGDIHFHAIMNAGALALTQARSAKSGRALTHNGKPIYNVKDWVFGFSTAEYITRLVGGEDERAAVSKYIFKYMGKQAGQKIGGRYVLTGGKLIEPVVVYGDAPEEFLGDLKPVYNNVVELDSGLVYREWSFV